MRSESLAIASPWMREYVGSNPTAQTNFVVPHSRQLEPICHTTNQFYRGIAEFGIARALGARDGGSSPSIPTKFKAI